MMNGIGSYAVAGAVIVTCAASIIYWSPTNSNKRDTPNFPNVNVPAMLVPPNQSTVVPTPDAGQGLVVPGGSPLPSVEGNLPILPGDVPPGVPIRPTVAPPANQPPLPTVPPSSTTTTCPVNLKLDPILGICVSL